MCQLSSVLAAYIYFAWGIFCTLSRPSGSRSLGVANFCGEIGSYKNS